MPYEFGAMSSPTSALKELRIDRSRESRSSPWVWITLLVLVALAAAGAGGWWLNQQHAKVVEVHTVAVREANSGAGTGADKTVLNASGYVTARREATVSSKVTGKVVTVNVEEGMKIKEGQIVARLDDTNVTVSLKLAQAQREATKASMDETRVRLNEAQKELDRQQYLTTRKFASQAEKDTAEATVMALKAKLQQQQSEVAVAQRTVESWEQQFEDTIIRAPFAGIVTSKNAQPGEMISPMSSGGFTRTGICTVVDMDSLEIEIDVNESYINRVVAGQAVDATLDAYPDWKIPCKVIAIIPTADRQKSTVRVRVGFDKLDPKILPEMSAKVAFRETPKPAGEVAAKTGPVYIVPKSAVSDENGRQVVFVIKNNTAERRAVTVQKIDGDDANLSAGVAPGERVSTERVEGLADGVAVKEISS